MGQNNNTTQKRTWKQLSEKDRYKIEALSAQGYTPVQIGQALTPYRNRRTIERELSKGMTLQRNSDLTEKIVYLADVAQLKTRDYATNKGRSLKIGNDHKLADHIENKIKNDKWSPDAVLGEIRAAIASDKTHVKGLDFKTTICTKTLYNYIDQGIFANISNKDLPIKKDGKKRNYKKVRAVALNNKTGKSISERPKEANERAEAGHWEIDLVVGKAGTKPAILTLIDRKTRKSFYVLVKSKTQKEVIAAIKRIKRKVGGNFSKVFKTITADNGSEFLDHIAIKQVAKCQEVYYAHPYSSWERGSNENGNRVLRRFVPKGTDISKLSAKELQRIEDWVNNYPRRIFGYKTANEMVG